MTRPWEVTFHIELARQIGLFTKGTPVKFASFFSWACDAAAEAGYETVYLPGELRGVDPGSVSESQLKRIDDEVELGCGANLNLQYHSERFAPRDGRQGRAFLRRHAGVLDVLIKPRTLSISSMYDHFVYWLAGGLANAREGWHFAFVGCGVPPMRAIALRTPWEAWEGPADEDAVGLLEASRARLLVSPESRIEYMRPNPIPVLRFRWKERWREIRCELNDRRAGSYFAEAGFSIPRTVAARLKRRFKHSPNHIWDLRSDEEVSALQRPFVYVPLHMEPESTILMYSPWFRDQAEVCRLLSQALPVGWRLVIKENPKMDGVRDLDFYRRLRSLPNAVLAHPRVSSARLIEMAELTVSLAGTASLEAKLIGRRGAVIGYPPFRFLFSDAEKEVSNLRTHSLRQCLSLSPTEIDVNRWTRWIRGTLPGRIVPRWTKTRLEVDPVTENVARFAHYIAGCLEPQ